MHTPYRQMENLPSGRISGDGDFSKFKNNTHYVNDL